MKRGREVDRPGVESATALFLAPSSSHLSQRAARHDGCPIHCRQGASPSTAPSEVLRSPPPPAGAADGRAEACGARAVPHALEALGPGGVGQPRSKPRKLRQQRVAACVEDFVQLHHASGMPRSTACGDHGSGDAAAAAAPVGASP
eukprot:357233-Chlamydomonas_euryale.AAC.1